MTLQRERVIASDHDDLVNAGLLEGRDDTLGDGDGTDTQHRLEISHAG